MAQTTEIVSNFLYDFDHALEETMFLMLREIGDYPWTYSILFEIDFLVDPIIIGRLVYSEYAEEYKLVLLLVEDEEQAVAQAKISEIYNNVLAKQKKDTK